MSFRKQVLLWCYFDKRVFIEQVSTELRMRTARQQPSPLGKVDFAKQKTDEVVEAYSFQGFIAFRHLEFHLK